MTNRFILGRHPLDGSFGVWLSKPGIDATSTVNPDNFLLCPGVKNEMVLMSGVASAGQTVFFPYTLSIKPFVMYNCTTSNGVDWYPFDIQQITRTGDTSASITTSSVTFQNFTSVSLVFLYLVTSRALP